MEQTPSQVAFPITLSASDLIQKRNVFHDVKAGRRRQGVRSHGQQVALIQVGGDRGSIQANHAIRARTQSNSSIARTQATPVIRGHVDAMCHMTIWSQDPQLVNELRRREAPTKRAHLGEGRRGPAAPQIVQLRSAAFFPLGLGMGFPQVDMQAKVTPARKVGKIQKRFRIQ